MNNEIDLNDAYNLLQKESNLQIGDTVKVLRKAESYEMGWNADWSESMDQLVNQCGKIIEINCFIVVEFDDKKIYYLPFFILEKINNQDINLSKKNDWVVCKINYSNQFTKNKLYQINHIDDSREYFTYLIVKKDDCNNINNGLEIHGFRPATDQEIFNHLMAQLPSYIKVGNKVLVTLGFFKHIKKIKSISLYKKPDSIGKDYFNKYGICLVIEFEDSIRVVQLNSIEEYQEKSLPKINGLTGRYDQTTNMFNYNNELYIDVRTLFYLFQGKAKNQRISSITYDHKYTITKDIADKIIDYKNSTYG